IDPHTYAVLALALEIGAVSGGVFDITVAPELVRANRLPRHASGHATRCGRMAVIVLGEDFRVQTTAPVALDVGGIAKGSAVDREGFRGGTGGFRVGAPRAGRPRWLTRVGISLSTARRGGNRCGCVILRGRPTRWSSSNCAIRRLRLRAPIALPRSWIRAPAA